jgi:hypothetical protein
VITEQSKRNIEIAFHKAARAHLIREAGDVFDIASAENGRLDERLGEKLLLITVSSFVFRLMTIFRIDDSPAMRAYYAPGAADRKLCEAFAEVANMCCGALNRELSVSFPHLAMSIPYTLSSRCIAFLGELKPQYLSSYAITINDSVRLHVTLCMSCSVSVEVGAAPAEVEDNVGELELL